MSSFRRFSGGGRWMGKDLNVIGSWVDGVDDPGSFTGGGESTLSKFHYRRIHPLINRTGTPLIFHLQLPPMWAVKDQRWVRPVW